MRRDARIARLHLSGIDHSAWAEPLKHPTDIGLRNGEAAFASLELARFANDLLRDVGRGEDDDPSHLYIAVFGIESEEAPRSTMLARIILAHEMASVRSIIPLKDVEAKRVQDQTEIDDADNVAVLYHAAMPVERVHCAP